MTIDEVIEKLTTLKRSGALDGDPEGVLAIEFSIGAIQQIAQMRLLDISPIAELLPGETKGEDLTIAENMKDYWRHQRSGAEG